MSTTVHVSGISHETSEKEVKDFFSFCGKITNLSITPASDAQDSAKSASVTFEKETAAKTALLLDNTQLGKSQVHVSTASSIDDLATKAGAAVSSSLPDDGVSQEDKPRTRIIAEYLAHGYHLSDQVIENAITYDKKHGYSNRFTTALSQFDEKYKASEKAKAMDNKVGATSTATSAWNGLNSYFEKALTTSTGQKLRDFYLQGDKQVRDIHSEARRLADLKSGTKHQPHSVGSGTQCSCGGAEGTCGCAPGQCKCSDCPRNDKNKSEMHQPQHVEGSNYDVCSCGGADGVCGCPAGKCACQGCSKSHASAVSEVKEVAQAHGQKLPSETFTS